MEESRKQKEAEELDKLPKDQRKQFHGLPVSIKECFRMKGLQSTAGLAHLITDGCTEDALVIQQLRSLGAIPFCLTNVPQTMYSLQTSNPVYGSTGELSQHTTNMSTACMLSGVISRKPL